MPGRRHHIEELLAGNRVYMKAHGNSMTPTITSGDTLIIDPIPEGFEFRRNQILFCRVRGMDVVHLVTGIKEPGQLQISNNHGHVNGWIHKTKVYGFYVGKKIL